MQEEAEAIDDKARSFVEAELLEPLTAALKSLDKRIEVEVEITNHFFISEFVTLPLLKRAVPFFDVYCLRQAVCPKIIL